MENKEIEDKLSNNDIYNLYCLDYWSSSNKGWYVQQAVTDLLSGVVFVMCLVVSIMFNVVFLKFLSVIGLFLLLASCTLGVYSYTITTKDYTHDFTEDEELKLLKANKVVKILNWTYLTCVALCLFSLSFWNYQV